MRLTNKAYDGLKFVALVLLPALSAAYFGLAQTWHVPAAEEVVGTLTVIDTLLGLVLRSSSTVYTPPNEKIDGALVVGEDEGQQYMGVAWDEKFPGIDTAKTQVVRLVIADGARKLPDGGTN